MTGKEFKDLRISKGYTQKEWGALLGVSAGTVSLIERGKREVKKEEEKKILTAALNKTQKTQKVNKSSRQLFTVYTDGGCGWNPGGPGGIGVVILLGKCKVIKEISKGYFSSTNNRMEIMAAIEGLKEIPEGSRVSLISDSQYLVNTMNSNWSKNKNQDLWKELDRVMAGKKVTFSWVRGHQGNVYNERCDALATEGIHSSNKIPDTVIPPSASGTGKRGDQAPAKGGAMGVHLEIPDDLGKMKDTDFYIRPECRKMIAAFNKGKKPKRFKDYMHLKTGGCDEWSSKGITKLRSLAGERVYALVIKYIPEKRNAAACLRWYGRGLSLEDSIRKTLVDQEISEKCTNG